MQADRQRSACFRLRIGPTSFPLAAVHRPKLHLRAALWLGLLLAAGFAAWSWLRPYEWNADSRAGFIIQAARVKRDRSYHWVDLHLEARDGFNHDLRNPVLLVSSSGKSLSPADTTFEGSPDTRLTALWLKFWLEKDDLAGPLTLRLNGGTLNVRSGAGFPSLPESNERVFSTCNW
jgi:hypothetical protein